MVLPEGLAVSDGDEGDVELIAACVEESLNVDGELRGALVEDGVLGCVVEEASHGDALLLAHGEGLGPILLLLPAVARQEVFQLDLLHELCEVVVGDAARSHLLLGVRVEELLAQRAGSQVRALGDVEHIVGLGTNDMSNFEGPKSREHSEQG